MYNIFKTIMSVLDVLTVYVLLVVFRLYIIHVFVQPAVIALEGFYLQPSFNSKLWTTNFSPDPKRAAEVFGRTSQ